MVALSGLRFLAGGELPEDGVADVFQNFVYTLLYDRLTNNRATDGVGVG